MAEQLANNAATTLSATMDGSTDPITFNVADGSEFPSAGNFRLRIGNEILLATARTSNQITANRAQENTAIASHAANVDVIGVFTKAALEAVLDDHATAADPHTGYQLETGKGAASGYASLDGDSLVPDAQLASTIARTADITTHANAADPHTGYQKESEKAAASGYASLDGTGRVPVAQLATGTPDGTLYLRDDRTWQLPSGPPPADHGALLGLTDDDHTQYQKESEKSAASGYASLDGTTKVPTAELGTGAADNTVFLRGDRAWAAAGSGVTDHGALTGLADDDHTQYQKESEKSAASGYASLDAGTLVPTAELGTGAASATKFLRGDQTWATPASTGITLKEAAFGFPGTVFTKTGTQRWYADRAYTCTSIITSLGTAPTGANLRLDINIDGATAFTNQTQRPNVTAGTNVQIKTTNLGNLVTLASGSYITLDVDQIGSTEPGAELTCQITFEAA